jgi:hypothetical protein
MSSNLPCSKSYGEYPLGGVLDGSIIFNVTYIVEKKADGDIGINVVHAGEKVSDNQIQRLSFAYRIPSDTEIAQSEAMKAKADAEKTQAEVDKISAEIKRANINQPLIHPASR